MDKTRKSVKISKDHHELLKKFCEKNGLIIHRTLEKWIEQKCGNQNVTPLSNNKGSIYSE